MSLDKHPDRYHLQNEFPEFFGFVREGKVSVCYSPIFREFSVPLKDGHATQQLHYCPWSGRKFPTSLRDQYFKVLETEHAFSEPTMDDIWEKRVPTEMQTEEWWIKRGL